MAITYKQSLIQILNKYIFQKAWNETVATYRTNIALSSVTGRYLRGRVNVGVENFALPTNNSQYLCFTTPIQAFFGGLTIPSNVWMTGEEVLNTTNTLMYVYIQEGKLIPRKYIHVFRSPNSDRVVIAIPKQVSIKVFGASHGTVYSTLYKDPDQPNDIICKSWYADPFDMVGSTSDLLTFFTTCKQANQAGTTVLVNGIEVDESLPIVSYVAGDYIEIICDENVIGAFDVDVSNNNTGYFSDLTSNYREIIHCPKTINPNNKVITHNTCTLSVRDSNGVGLYYHRADDTGVGQITHNDLSVSTDVIDAFRSYLNDQNVTIHVRVRHHDTDNVLITELFYMTFLYRNSDEDIVQHMRGAITNTLPFWKASELEQSTYTAMMFDTPNSIDESLLTTYVEGLGYHTVAAILASHVFHTSLSGTQRTVKVTKSAALSGKSVYPMVYLRGSRLNSTQYTYADGENNVTISINEPIYLTGNDTVSVITLEDGPSQPYSFYPILGDSVITVPFRDVTVFEEVTLAETLNGHTISSDVAYKELEFSAGTLIKALNTDGTTTITAGAAFYGKTLIVVNKHFTSVYGFDITDTVNVEKGAIALPLTMGCFNEAKTIPALGWNRAEAHVNGFRLVEDLDVTVRALVDGDGNVAGLEAVVSCDEYIDASGSANNWAEVVLHTGTTISQERGYVYEGKVSYDTNINIWHSPLGACFVKGKLMQNPTHEGHYLEPVEAISTGDPYDLAVGLPGSIGEVLEGYDRITDLNRLTAIQNYFLQSLNVDKSVVELTTSYMIHSPYLAAIISDLIGGTLTAINDPDDTLFLAQFVDYEYLKDRDPTITDPEGVVDRTYVDVLTTYIDSWTVPTPEMLTLINRLAELALPNDPNALGDTY